MDSDGRQFRTSVSEFEMRKLWLHESRQRYCIHAFISPTLLLREHIPKSLPSIENFCGCKAQEFGDRSDGRITCRWVYSSEPLRDPPQPPLEVLVVGFTFAQIVVFELMRNHNNLLSVRKYPGNLLKSYKGLMINKIE